MTEGPTAARRRLGMLLKAMRVAAGKTGEEAGRAVDRSAPWVSHLEAGRVGLRPRMLDELLKLYSIDDAEVRREMHELALAGRERGWWSKYASILSAQYATYVGYEASAAELLIYETLVVHGLLQTREYAEAVVRTSRPGEPPELVDKLVTVRLNRQKRLTGDPALRLLVVLDEAVLHRVIGGDWQTHRAQLVHLLDIARTWPTVRLQIVPFEHSAYPGMVSSFTILKFPGSDPDIVYVETLTGDRYEDPPESDRYTLAYGDLRAVALSETASVGLIESVLNHADKTREGHP